MPGSGASGTGPAAQAGEAGAGISLPSRRAPTVGRRLDSRLRRQLGAGKGLEFRRRRGNLGPGRGGAGGRGSGPGWTRGGRDDGQLAITRQSTALPGLDYAKCASSVAGLSLKVTVTA